MPMLDGLVVVVIGVTIVAMTSMYSKTFFGSAVDHFSLDHSP